MTDDEFGGLSPASRKGPGLEPGQEATIEHLLGVRFPADYLRFLRWGNGWEGWLGDQYLRLHGVDELSSANDAAFRQAFPDLVAIGSDGALETYALDLRSDRLSSDVVALDRNSADERDIWPVAAGFLKALEAIGRGRSGDIPPR